MLFQLLVILIVSSILFFLGAFGFLLFSIRSNFFVLISFEVMFLSVNLNFFFFSLYIDSLQGILFIFFIIVISAVEIVIFLSFFVVYYRKLFVGDSTESFSLIKK